MDKVFYYARDGGIRVRENKGKYVEDGPVKGKLPFSLDGKTGFFLPIQINMLMHRLSIHRRLVFLLPQRKYVWCDVMFSPFGTVDYSFERDGQKYCFSAYPQWWELDRMTEVVNAFSKARRKNGA